MGNGCATHDWTMKRILPICVLAVLCSCASRGQGTDLPGPVSALPNDVHTVSYGICSYSKLGVNKSCLRADLGNINNYEILSTDTGYFFDNNIFPVTNLTSFLGFTTNEFLNAHIQSFYNYGPSYMSFYSDVAGLVLDGNCAAPGGATGCPILFYTHGTPRGQFDDSGLLLSNGAGSGNRCAYFDASGYFHAKTTDCGNPALYTTCNSPISPLSTYASIGCSLTSTATGTWLVSSSVLLTVSGPTSGATFAPYVNGFGVLGPSDVGVLLLSSGGVSEANVASISRTWIFTMNSGDTLDIRAASAAGTSASGVGNLSAVFLHP